MSLARLLVHFCILTCSTFGDTVLKRYDIMGHSWSITLVLSFTACHQVARWLSWFYCLPVLAMLHTNCACMCGLQLDQRIMNAVRRVHEHKRRRAFFLGFSQSPVDFINALVASQGRDLRFMKGENGVEYEAMRRSDLFKGKWVEDAVLRHLHKRLAAG